MRTGRLYFYALIQISGVCARRKVKLSVRVLRISLGVFYINLLVKMELLFNNNPREVLDFVVGRWNDQLYYLRRRSMAEYSSGTNDFYFAEWRTPSFNKINCSVAIFSSSLLPPQLIRKLTLSSPYSQL